MKSKATSNPQESRFTTNYTGWLGHRNLGDEASFLVAKQKFFKDFNMVPYDCYRFLAEGSSKFLTGIGSQSSSISIFGGGTLLPDDITWIKPAKYNYIFGAGVKDPTFENPRYYTLNKTILKRLRKFSFREIGVRGERSKTLLNDYGLRSEVIGDPCLSICSRARHEKNPHKIAINVGTDGFQWGRDKKKVVQQVISVCRILKNEGFDPILVPFYAGNVPEVARIGEIADVEVFENWLNIQAVLDLIASCRILIGEKLHSLVFAASTYTPFICIEYRPKCSEFSQTMGFEDYCIRTDIISDDAVVKMFHDLLDEYTRMQELLTRKVNYYKEKQEDFARRIKDSIETLPDVEFKPNTWAEAIKRKVFWDTDVILRKNAGNLWRAYNHLVFLRIMHLLT